MCELTDDPICHQLHSCQACTSHPYCRWDHGGYRCHAEKNLTTGESQVKFYHFGFIADSCNFFLRFIYIYTYIFLYFLKD